MLVVNSQEWHLPCFVQTVCEDDVDGDGPDVYNTYCVTIIVIKMII